MAADPETCNCLGPQGTGVDYLWPSSATLFVSISHVDACLHSCSKFCLIGFGIAVLLLTPFAMGMPSYITRKGSPFAAAIADSLVSAYACIQHSSSQVQPSESRYTQLLYSSMRPYEV